MNGHQDVFRATKRRTRGPRTIALSPEAVSLLKELREDFIRIHGREPGADDLVFPDAPRGLAMDAMAWSDMRNVGTNAPALAFSALRVSGAMRLWSGNEDQLREVAEHLGHTPPTLYGADEERFLRRYLPVYGEIEADHQRRTAGDMPGFGRWVFGCKGYAWYLNGRRSKDPLWRLFWLLDSERDVFDMTANEALLVLRKHDGVCAAEAVAEIQDLSDDAQAEWLEAFEDYVRPLRALCADRLRAWQAHIFGEACAGHTCGLGPIERPDVGGVYFVRSTSPSDSAVAVKIGWGKSISKRIRDLSTAHPWPLDLLAFIPDASIQDETALHREFEHLRIDNSPGREWFHLRKELLGKILSLREENNKIRHGGVTP